MKPVRLLLPLIFAAAPTGSPSPHPSRPTDSVVGAFFALSVPDLEASARWYQSAFGLRVVRRIPPANGAAVTVLEGPGLIVELIRHDGALPLAAFTPPITDRVMVHGIVKAGFVVRDFDTVLGRLRAQHVDIPFGPFPAQGAQRANAILRDNAGNLIQIFGG
jgi:catechol 2,3-dioxygenase-like lactoylglutathione lyase family enzyme